MADKSEEITTERKEDTVVKNVTPDSADSVTADATQKPEGAPTEDVTKKSEGAAAEDVTQKREGGATEDVTEKPEGAVAEVGTGKSQDVTPLHKSQDNVEKLEDTITIEKSQDIARTAEKTDGSVAEKSDFAKGEVAEKIEVVIGEGGPTQGTVTETSDPVFQNFGDASQHTEVLADKPTDETKISDVVTEKLENGSTGGLLEEATAAEFDTATGESKNKVATTVPSPAQLDILPATGYEESIPTLHVQSNSGFNVNIEVRTLHVVCTL